MGWTWYLSNDMQLFAISPLILYPIQRGMCRRMSGARGTIWRAGGWLMLVLLAVISLAVTFGLSAAHDLPPNLFPPNVSMAPKIEWMMSNVAYQPYNHAVCYFAGMTLGYAFCQLRNRHFGTNGKPEVPVRWPKVSVLAWWLLSSVMGFFVVFGLWREYRGYTFPASLAAFYDSCSRLGWSVVVGWVIFACLSGNGGLVNTFLSWKLFLPLSRMTYCAYLIHPMLMYWFYFSMKDTYYYQDFTMTWFFGGFVLFSYMAAFFVTLVFEAPFLAMDKMIFSFRRIKND